MRKRSASVLLHLLPGSGVIPTVDKLSELYHITPRTLRSDIDEINNFLLTIGQPAFAVDNLGLIKSRGESDPTVIRAQLFGISYISYKFSPEERQLLILASMTDESGYVTMESLAEKLFVTRITVMSDIELMKEYLDGFSGIALSSKSSKGIRLLCAGEASLRILLMDVFRRVVVKINAENAFLHILMRELGFTHPLEEIASTLRDFERENNLLFSEESFYEISLYFFIGLNRAAGGHHIPFGEAPPAKGGEVLAAVLDHLRRETRVDMGAGEAALLMQDGLTDRISISLQKNVDIVLYKIISYFLLKVGGRFGGTLQHDRLLLESLHADIKSMSDAANIGFDFSKDLGFQSEYWKILEEIDRNSCILEKYLARKLSEKMKFSIFIHICAALIRNRKYASALSVLVVCPGSMATGRLVEAQLRNRLDVVIRGVVSADRLVDSIAVNGGDVDCIVSTVAVDTDQCPVVTVKPVLTVEDFEKVRNLAVQLGSSNNKNDSIRFNILRHIDKALDEVGAERGDALVRDLEKVIRRYLPAEDGDGGRGIAEMLSRENILVVDEGMGWMDAVRRSGELLLRAGHIEAGYIEEIVANIIDYGPYIIFGGRIALAHAKPGANVRSEGLSLLLSRGGIVFDGDEPSPEVHVMLCLSTEENGQYMTLLHQIVRLSENDAFVAAMLEVRNASDIPGILARHTRRRPDGDAKTRKSSRRISRDT